MLLESNSFLFCFAALHSAQIRQWEDFVDCNELVIANFNWILMKCDPIKPWCDNFSKDFIFRNITTPSPHSLPFFCGC